MRHHLSSTRPWLPVSGAHDGNTEGGDLHETWTYSHRYQLAGGGHALDLTNGVRLCMDLGLQ